MNSKQKGATYERDICKKLSVWASGGFREDLFWRSAMSGGRSTIQFKKGKLNRSQSGDISSIDRLGSEFIEKFCIECKHYQNLDLIPGIVHNRGALHGFWRKLCKDAIAIDKLPILLAKQNRLPSLLLISPAGALILNLRKGSAIATLYQWNAVVYVLEDLLGCEYPF